MGEVDLRALLVDVRAALRSNGLHDEVDLVSQELEAALASRDAKSRANSCAHLSRAEDLKSRCELYDRCYEVLQRLCTSTPAGDGFAPLQQRLWGRSMEVSREWSILHEQQRQELDSLGASYQHLKQEHQVLRSNLKSLKLTVQQLLTDVSTLLQHTASARQQQVQQQHQQPQQPQQQPTATWSKQPGLQQQLLRAGLTTGTSHRDVHGGRRCASADGGVPPSAAASGGEGSSSMVAVTMQRLIASIEKMSRHFADCQAGKLIGDYSSSSSSTMGRQAGSGSSSSSVTMPGGTATRANNSTASTAAAAVGTGTGATSGQHVPRPPSSSSNSSRPGITSKVPGPPVLRGVAAAAAAISTAMANAAGQISRQLLTQQQQQQEQSHSTAVAEAPLPAAKQASADDGMRHSFDSTQARAAADAWFANKARASSSLLASADTADMHSSRHAAGATDASSASLSSSRHSSDVGSTSRHYSSDMSRQGEPCQRQQGASSCSSQGTAHNPRHVQLEQQQQQVPEEPGSQPGATAPEHGRLAQGGNGSLVSSGARQQASQASDVAAAGASKQLQRPSGPSAAATAAAQAASAQATFQGQVVGQPFSSSSSSLGRSQSEVWAAPHSSSTGHAANGRAVTSDPGLVTPWSVRQQQQQQGPHTSLSQLQSGHRTKHPDRPSPTLTSSRPSGVWGGSSVRQAASRSRPLTAGGLLPSGPLTAALNSSTAHRQAHSSRHSRDPNPHSPQQRREQQVPGGRGPTADDCSSWAASSSRSASSCSQRSAHSSNSCVSTAPQHWPHGSAGGHVGAHSANSRGMRAALVSASSSSSLGSDAVLLGSFTTAASGSANNSPASKSVTSVLSSPAGATQDLAGGRDRARLTQDEASSTPHRVVTATGSPDARRAGQSHHHQQQQQQAYSAAVPAGTGPPKAARALQWSDHPSKRQSDAAAEPTPAAARGPTAGHASSSTAEQLKPAGSTQPDAAAAADAAPKGELSAVTGQQLASIEPAQAASKSSGQQRTSAAAVPDAAVPGQVTELQSSLKVQPRQQLQLQPVLPCLLGGRVRIGLLSPILEEGIGSNGSTNTTPGTPAGSPAVAAPLRGAFSNGSCRSSSKLRSSSSEAPSAEAVAATAAQESVPASAAAVPAVQPQSDYAAAREMPDAFKQGSRESSPKPCRVESPPDTAVGRDTTPCGPGGFAQQRRKQTGIHDQQEQTTLHNGSVEHSDAYMVQAVQDKQQQQQQHLQRQHMCLQQLADDGMEHSAARAMSRSSPTFGEVLDAAAGSGSRRPRSAHMCRRSWDGSGSSGDQPLAAFPVDLGPLSHSIESLDTVLMDTSCCFSEEDVCIDSLGSSSSRQGLQLPAGNAAAGTKGAATAVCMLDLQDLLAIVLDVMNDKQAADKRYMATGLPQPTLGRHLQCYVAAKVHSDQPAYSSAMAAILTGLEQHKQVQPEIAVLCRVLSDELDEDYFHQRHLRIRQQLQQLATQAAMEGAPQQQQQQSHMWENCCSIPLCESKLLLMLRAWAGQRDRLLHALQQPADAEAVQQLVTSWERDIRMHCGCGPEQAVRAGSAVAALLLWELQQHLAHLQPIAAAFKAADARCQGVLGLAGFRVFCRHLNQAMSDEEVQLLFYEELRGKQHDQVTFTAICRVLLPAMCMPTQ